MLGFYRRISFWPVTSCLSLLRKHEPLKANSLCGSHPDSGPQLRTRPGLGIALSVAGGSDLIVDGLESLGLAALDIGQLPLQLTVCRIGRGLNRRLH